MLRSLEPWVLGPVDVLLETPCKSFPTLVTDVLQMELPVTVMVKIALCLVRL